MNITDGAQILVVEDSAELNSALCDILDSYGYRPQGALNGYEAMEYLRVSRPDVILCDIMMPGMDGYTLLQHTRSDANLRTLPFIFLTALSSSEAQRRAREIGIDDYLTKPVDSRDLVVAIENALNRHRMMEDAGNRKLDELRHRIVGLLQHEFRTPLTFVLGYAELIANSDPANLNWNELRMAAASILDGGHRLQALIESFLLLAALQERRLDPDDLMYLSAANLLSEVARKFTDDARAANLTIDVRVPREPLTVSGDPQLLLESLFRLMDNAIRYRRPESQHVWLSIVTLSPYIGLRIADEGRGISPEAVTELSQPFDQALKDEHPTTGAGLSLAVVQRVAHVHGGRLQVESTPGQGSTFTLWLPAAVPCENTPPAS